MKIYIPSKDRAKTITTHLWLEKNNIPYSIVVHNEEQFRMYGQQLSWESFKNVINANCPYGMSVIRQWIRDNLVKDGEWYINMDDNIKYFQSFPSQHYNTEFIDTKNSKNLRKTLENHESTRTEFEDYVEETKVKAESLGVSYCGFATVENYFFRGKKWRTVAYVVGKCILCKKNELSYDQNIIAMDDYGFTAENLLKKGRVLVNNFVKPIANHYQDGGIGTYSERLNAKIEDCAYLMTKYPGLYRYNPKKSGDPRAELQLRFHSERQVEKWRANALQNSPSLFTNAS